MELRHLRYFSAVADELSFRGAAAKLHVAQASISSQIRLLEEEMRVRLLERDKHKVSLTPAGRSFLESCRRTLHAVEEDTRTAQAIARGEAGRISIGFVGSLGVGLLPSILLKYGRRFPKVELELTEMDSSQQIKALEEHRLDLGLIGLGLHTNEMSDLRIATVAEEKLYAAVPQDHPLAKAARRNPKPLPLAELANESFLFGARSSAPVFNPWLVVLCNEAGFQPHIRQEAGQPMTVLNYIAAGLGVTILPAQFRRLHMVGVTFIALADPVPRYRYCAAWSRDNRHPAVPHLVQVAQEVAKHDADDTVRAKQHLVAARHKNKPAT